MESMSESIVDIGKPTGFNSSKYVDVIAIQQSQTWSPARDCIAKVVAIGAGGSGGIARENSTIKSSGGAAGGLACLTEIELKSDINYSAVIGAGGTTVFAASSVTGIDGGNTSFIGGAVNLLAKGGQKGTNKSFDVSIGGGASGGDILLKGGDGGIPNNNNVSTGGGAVNVGLFVAGESVAKAKGGAGLTGFSSDIATSGHISASKGGRSVMHSEILDFLGILATKQPSEPIAQGNENYGFQDNIVMDVTPDIGVGGSALAIWGYDANSSKSTSWKAQNGGMFAGGGSIRIESGVGLYSVKAGDGGIGAGGGSVYSRQGYAHNGAGGDGIIFIAVKEYL